MTTAFRDVRMRGFTQRTEVSEALNWVDQHSHPLPAEVLAIEHCANRVLAQEVISPLNVPEFDRAAMDGFALHGQATTGASEYNPLAFTVVGTALPGQPCAKTHLSPHSAIRIMTGAPLPAGMNAVIPAEYAEEANGVLNVTRPVSPGQHVGHVGEDIAQHTQALPAGRRLRPQDVGLVASLGLAELPVVRQPRVRILVTGNEVRAPGTPKGPFDIYDANSVTLRGLIARDGGVLESHQRLGDQADTIAQALTAPGADVLLISGGSSVGSEDHAPRLLAQYGELAIHGVSMRPSSPAGMGRMGEALVFLLPGNPVSCLCAYDFFAGRAIRRLGGRRADWPYPSVQAEVARKIVSQVGRTDYVRVKLTERGVEPIALSGASVLSSTTRADGFVIVPPEAEGYGEGSAVTVYLYECP